MFCRCGGAQKQKNPVEIGGACEGYLANAYVPSGAPLGRHVFIGRRVYNLRHGAQNIRFEEKRKVDFS
jgi:hypothetical protein